MKCSLHELIDLWLKEPNMKQASKDTLKHTRRALKELLESLGFKTLTLKPSEYYSVLNNISLEHFFQAVESRLVVGETVSLQASSGLSAEFWINGICGLYKQSVASKNPQTIKNRSSALSGFASFLIHRPEWSLLRPLDIPLIRPAPHGRSLPRVYPERQREVYGLLQKDWPQHVRDEAEALKQFWSTGGEEAWEELQEQRELLGQPIGNRPKVLQAKPETIDMYFKFLNSYFGWQVHVEKIPEEDLTFKSITNLTLIRKYNRWLRKRGCSHGIVVNLIRVSIIYAKMKNFAKTQRRNWRDIAEILNFQDLQAEFREKFEKEKQESVENKKPLRDVSHHQLQQMQGYLLQLCAPCIQSTSSKTGKSYLKERPKSAILQAKLVYTLCAFETFVPVRQQEVRTTIEGESLLRRLDKEGKLAYILYSKEHKLEGHTGEPHVCVLPRNLVPILDDWAKTFRPLAEQAVENLDNWLEFWGYKPDALQKLQARLEAAHKGVVPKHIKNIPSYIDGLKKRIRSVTQRIKALPQARENLKSHNYLFFTLGGRRPESFGKPLSVSVITGLITRAMAEASRAVLGKVYRITPHVFRYIAALHIRRIKGDVDLLCKVMNHSRQMSDDYGVIEGLLS